MNATSAYVDYLAGRSGLQSLQRLRNERQQELNFVSLDDQCDQNDLFVSKKESLREILPASRP